MAKSWKVGDILVLKNYPDYVTLCGWSKDGIFVTYYIGEKDQNEKMDKISEDLLKAIKPIVDLMKRDPKGAGNFMDIEDSSIPEVKQSRVRASNIPK